jgi:hypothetical protein
VAVAIENHRVGARLSRIILHRQIGGRHRQPVVGDHMAIGELGGEDGEYEGQCNDLGGVASVQGSVLSRAATAAVGARSSLA